ncbi:MAG: alpha/beta hydrolase [Myxococcales bacterium FL481]|nr:MAG: alpha/beta hydrolase [Myxococcales bacterium FL481]
MTNTRPRAAMRRDRPPRARRAGGPSPRGRVAAGDRDVAAPTLIERTRTTLVAVCCVVMACAFSKLKTDVEQSLESTVIVGWIDSPKPADAPLIALAYTLDGSKQVIVHHTVLHEAGEYELVVPGGRYYVCAYWDLNHNLTYDAGEPGGQYGAPDPVAATAGGVLQGIHFRVPPGGNAIALPHGVQIAEARPENLRSRQAGAVVSLADARFDAELARRGWWEPMDFYREIGGNIYFLEPYTPDKVPVLFIHGASGTPRDWEFMITRLDRTRFQPWLFYYPSGSRLKGTSHLLLWKLLSLHTKYKFDVLFITAHSMGGLVARSLIVDHGHLTPYVRLLIALATPWGGARMAEKGVKRSPAVIPSWIDMQPDGDFIQSLYRQSMPENISFYMFTGHRGDRNPLKRNNDGAIALSSLLDSRPQAEATMNYAFSEDHASIVRSVAVVEQYNAVLQLHASEAQEARADGGYLSVEFRYDYPLPGPAPRPILVLRPVGKGAPVRVDLSAADSGRQLGPFPSGEYVASLVAPSVKPDQFDVKISLSGGATETLRSTFTPDGMAFGNIVAAAPAQDQAVGMPAEQHRPGTPQVNVRTVTLRGAGIQRSLRPHPDPNRDFYGDLVSSTDYCSGDYFHFFGLPAGSYQVEIVADGFRRHIERYRIVPGKPMPTRSIALRRH